MDENRQEDLVQEETVAEEIAGQENQIDVIAAPSVSAETQPEEAGAFAPIVQAGEQMPDKKSRYCPISAWGYFGIFLLMAIPVIGWLLIIIWACGGCRKVNKRNMARGVLLNFLLQVILIVIALAVAGTFWVKSGLKDTFTDIQRIVEQIDIQKLGSAVQEIDPETIEALSKLQDMDPEILNCLVHVSENIENDGEGEPDSAGLIDAIQNIQGLDSQTVKKYMEDPTVKEFMNNPELLKKLQSLEGFQEVTSIEDVKELINKLDDLSDVLGDENNKKLQELINKLK